jgi:hypothetical protein
VFFAGRKKLSLLPVSQQLSVEISRKPVPNGD